MRRTLLVTLAVALSATAARRIDTRIAFRPKTGPSHTRLHRCALDYPISQLDYTEAQMKRFLVLAIALAMCPAGALADDVADCKPDHQLRPEESEGVPALMRSRSRTGSRPTSTSTGGRAISSRATTASTNWSK